MGTFRPDIRRWLVLRRWPSRRALISLTVLVLLGLAHAPILRLLAWPLRAGGSGTACDCFCIHGSELGVDGFEVFEQAAAWHHGARGAKDPLAPAANHAHRGDRRGAVVRADLPERVGQARRAAGRCLPDPRRGRRRLEEAHAMEDWLKEHPGATVSLACSPFSSGRLRYVFNKVIGPADAERVRLRSCPILDRRIETWWRSRKGVKDFMYAWLELIYAWAEGDDARPVPAGAAAFQQEIRDHHRRGCPMKRPSAAGGWSSPRRHPDSRFRHEAADLAAAGPLARRGRPSAEGRRRGALERRLNTRPFVAAALVHGGWAPKIILNTVAAHPNQVSGEVPPSFEINLKVLDYGGVPRDRVVLLDSDVKTTFDEAKAVAGYLAEHPARKTADRHRRAPYPAGATGSFSRSWPIGGSGGRDRDVLGADGRV